MPKNPFREGGGAGGPSRGGIHDPGLRHPPPDRKTGSDRFGRATEDLAARTSRRGLLARAGRVLVAGTAGGVVAKAVKPGEADAHHFCGHIYTTASCPHPTGLPRIDARGLPLRAVDGQAVDDLGRPVDREGRALSDSGRVLRDPDGRPLASAPRTPVCSATGARYGFRGHVDGAWFRCCGGHVRKLVDCCSTKSYRINGDKALTGYCYSGRKVFCVMYFQTRVPC